MSQTLKCEICGFENPATHRYCGNCGHQLTGAPAAQNGSNSLIAAPIEGERKQVTIIFADISGFTALNDAAKTPAEVEYVVRLINDCLEELSEAIYEYDGYIDKYMGDAIMAVFGAPRAHEDDPERALRAALGIRDRMAKFNKDQGLQEPLGIHMGINTGTVIAGMVGTDRKRSYTVMGDAVNVASRLEGVSERGELLVSEATFNLTRHLFEFEGRNPVKVKGKRDPLKIYNLKGLGGSRPKPPEAPILGRDFELESLLKQYRKLFDRQGNIVVITGDAGLGKSRLISEFGKLAKRETPADNEPLWLFGRGLSYRQSFKNRLFVDILYSYLELPQNPDDTLVKMRLNEMGDKLFGQRKTDVMPYLATLLGISPDSEIDLPQNEQVLQQRMFLAMGEWLEALVSRQPVVLIFEDLHWADPSSVSLIEYLFTVTLYNPVLILCITRPERDSAFWRMKTNSQQDFPEHLTELVLWPLSDAESRQLIKHLIKIDQMPQEMEDLLLTRSEGNPLFMEEVLRGLIDAGAIQHTDGHWQITRSVTEMDIPHTLQGVLMARIDRLDEQVKRVLQVAAVIGRYFSESVLKPIVGDNDVLEDALAQLVAAELIELRSKESEHEYMFKHMLTHETTYNSLLHQQRKLIHKQIADYMARLFWMLGEEYAPIVADHYYKSETWPRAMRYLQRAGDAAVQSFANEEAIQFYNRTLEVAEMLGEEADQAAVLAVHEGRAKLFTRLGEPQRAIADYEAMLAKAKELQHDSAEMRALNGLGELQSSYYNFTEAKKFFQDALTVARRIGDEHGKALTLNLLGNFYTNTGQFEEGIQSYREAREISVILKDEALRIEAEDGLAKIMLEQGEITASLERYEEEIISVRRRLGYRRGLMSSLSSVLIGQIYAADYKKAMRTAAEALELHEHSGDLYRIPFIKSYQALGQLHLGELGQAGRNLHEGLAMAEEQKQRSSLLLGLTWLSYYYLNIGMHEEGLDVAHQALGIAEELGSPPLLFRARLMVGSAHRHIGQVEQAIPELEAVYEKVKHMGLVLDDAMTLYQLARAYADTEQWEKASQTVDDLIALARASEMKEFITRGQWVRSLVEINAQRHDAALSALIEASDIAEQTDSRLSQYLIQIQKSYVYQTNGNNAAARDAIVYAQKIQKRLLDSIDDAATRNAFLNTSHSRHFDELVQATMTAPVKLDAIGDNNS